MRTHNYAQIAADYTLWVIYVDPDGAMSREEFESLAITAKVKLIVDAFGV